MSKKYEVIFQKTTREIVRVEANSETEATDLVYDNFGQGDHVESVDYSTRDFDVLSTDEVFE